MDYVSVIIPHSLKGAGEVPVVLTVHGFTANVVTHQHHVTVVGELEARS